MRLYLKPELALQYNPLLPVAQNLYRHSDIHTLGFTTDLYDHLTVARAFRGYISPQLSWPATLTTIGHLHVATDAHIRRPKSTITTMTVVGHHNLVSNSQALETPNSLRHLLVKHCDLL